MIFGPDPDWDGATSTASRLPLPRGAGHDALRKRRSRGVLGRRTAPTPVATGLPGDVEAQLAALAGVGTPPPVAPVDSDVAPVTHAPANMATHLLRVAEIVTVGCLVLIVVWALLSAQFGDASSHFHQLPFAAWGLGAGVCALTSAKLASDSSALALLPLRRRLLSAALLVALLVCVTGVVVNTDGAAGPPWVLFLPVLLMAGAVGGPAVGLGTGAGAAAGLYAATAKAHTLGVDGIGRLVVLLPAFPAIGWSAGALAALARAAADEAETRRRALEQDVAALSDVLADVGAGDLSLTPAAGPTADPATTAVAVAFADTLVALRRLVHRMDGVAGQLSSSAAELAGSAENEANAINAQVAAVEETTQTVEQLAGTAGAIAETAVRVAQLAGSTRTDLDAGAGAVDDVTDAMLRIDQRMQELDGVVAGLQTRIRRVAVSTQVIDELARRTSMLAVNAAVEAARAEPHGQGFRHVAEEISDLATRAREATARIHGIVAELDAEVVATAEAGRDGEAALHDGALLQSDVVAALARISAMVDHTTLAAREITEATRQQRVAADAVVDAMTSVLGAGQLYREGGQRHADAAVRLRDLAGALRGSLDRFRLDDERPDGSR